VREKPNTSKLAAIRREATPVMLGHQGGAVPGGCPRDLVDLGRRAGRDDQLVQLGRAVVADPDGAGQPLVPRGQQFLPGRDQGPVPRRPVDQPEVHILHGQRPEAALEGAPLPAGGARRQLGGEEQLLARDAAVADRPADLALVAVHGGGVDVAVADLQRRVDGRLAARPRHLPGAEADQRHGATVVERHGGLAAVRLGGHGSPIAAGAWASYFDLTVGPCLGERLLNTAVPGAR
jgi:hypothetical protein